LIIIVPAFSQDNLFFSSLISYVKLTLLFAGILNFMPLLNFKLSYSWLPVFTDITPFLLAFLYVEVKVTSISFSLLFTISNGYSSSGRKGILLGLIMSPLLDLEIVKLFLFTISTFSLT